MSTLIIIAAIYLIIGMSISAAVAYGDWRQGEDFTVGDLLSWAVRSMIWPIGVLIYLDDRMTKPLPEIVLIRGSRSARMLKELRKDEN